MSTWYLQSAQGICARKLQNSQCLELAHRILRLAHLFFEWIMQHNHRMLNRISKQQDCDFYLFILVLIFCPEFFFLVFLNYKEKISTTFNQIKIFYSLSFLVEMQPKLNVHKTFMWRIGRRVNVLSKFNLGRVSTRFQKLYLDYGSNSYTFF